MPDLPNPTMSESGFPDFIMTFWQGVVAQAGTAPAIIARLNAVINEGLASPAMQASLATFKVEPKPGSPEDFAQFLAAEVKKWAGVIRQPASRWSEFTAACERAVDLAHCVNPARRRPSRKRERSAGPA